MGPRPSRRVVVGVRGALGGPCDFLHPIEQRRQEATVTIEILRRGAAGEPCTLLPKFFNAELALPGAFAAGEYTVRVNTFSRTFRVE